MFWTEEDEWIAFPELKLTKEKFKDYKRLYKEKDIKGRRFLAFTSVVVKSHRNRKIVTLADLLAHYSLSTLLVDVGSKRYILVSSDTSFSRAEFDKVFELWAEGRIAIRQFFLAIVERKRNGRAKIIKIFKVPFPLWCTLYPAQGLRNLKKIPKYYILSYDDISEW
ncbi:MAG: hypothetical protein J7L20_03725 [Thermoplasmata archaeon]|nr:hypothetical protein [Thermoplasmata archaeon]